MIFSEITEKQYVEEHLVFPLESTIFLFLTTTRLNGDVVCVCCSDELQNFLLYTLTVKVILS